MASGWNSFTFPGPSQGDPLQFLLDFQGALLDFKGSILRFLSDLKWMPGTYPGTSFRITNGPIVT